MSLKPRRAGPRALLGAGIGLSLVAAAAIAFTQQERAQPVPPTSPQARAGEQPVLLLLTSLPLVFGERFGLEEGGSPALSAMETRFRVVPISTTDAANLRQAPLLLMAQPRAQPAEMLVALDRWVRRGGRLLLLADPALEWKSERPLGDRFRPPAAFADTGLLGHWGLRLDAPDERGPRQQQLGARQLLTASPGRLVRVSGDGCAVDRYGLVARCRIGKGRATIVADADFLDVARLDGPTGHNLDALLDEIDALAR